MELALQHSYDAPFFDMIDDFFPDSHEELVQLHFDAVFDNVIAALSSQASRTFTHYETKLFSDWYYRQNE